MAEPSYDKELTSSDYNVSSIGAVLDVPNLSYLHELSSGLQVQQFSGANSSEVDSDFQDKVYLDISTPKAPSNVTDGVTSSKLQQQHRLAEELDKEQTENQKEYQKIQDLKLLLSNWDLDYLLDHLVDQNVFIDVLKVIKQHHIERLLTTFDMGTQILFEHKLEQWRQTIGIPLLPNHGDSLLLTSHSSSPSVSPSTSRASTPQRRFNPYPKSDTQTEKYTIFLSSILNETSKGNMLMEYYKKYSQFQEEQRNALIHLIAQFFEEKGIQMSLSASYELEKEILDTFPTEKLEYYRSGKRGRIYNKSINIKTSFSSAVYKHLNKKETPKKSTYKYRPETLFVPEDDADLCLRALKFDNLSSDQFDSTWKACTQYRLHDIRNLITTKAIMDKWPFYRLPTGFRLIDMDFKASFNNGNDLLDGWPKYVEKIVTFLSNDNNVKDKKTKALIEKIKTTDNLGDNSKDATLFLALHAFFIPTARVVTKDGSGRNKTTRFTMKDSQDSFLIVARCLQQIEDHIDHLKKTKQNIQPFIYCIGSDSFSIEEIYLYFDDIRYKFFSVLRAVDLCFKTIYLFNLDFPIESKMFYSFIESLFFKLKSQQSFSKVFILSEYLENNVE